MAKKSSGKSRKLTIPDQTITEWNGLNTYIKDIKELEDGATPDQINWITGTYKDHIELRRGQALLGTNRAMGVGRVSGLGIGVMANGTQIPFFTYSSKLLYYNIGSNLTVEIGTNILGTAAANDDVSVMPYQNIPGAWVYFTSPNSSIFRLSPAVPTSVADLNIRDYKGYAKIDSNRMYSWGRKSSAGILDATDLIVGVVDKSSLSQYTQTTNQVIGAGNNTAKTFAFNLTQTTGYNNVPESVFAIEIATPVTSGVSISAIPLAVQPIVTANGHGLVQGDFFIITGAGGMTQINGLIGVVRWVIDANNIAISLNTTGFTAYTSGASIFKVEHFIDDQNGNMVSNFGGTGTIDYIKGTGSVTFNTAPINLNNIYAQYYQEDSSTGGVTDFSQSSTSGQGKTFPQFDGGGPLLAVWPFDQVQYCFHQIKTWYVNLTNTDSNATNLPYRSNFGIPYFRSAYPTPDGILMLDNSHPAEPKIRFLEISPSVAALITIVPTPISDSLDLSPYGFSNCVVRRFGDYDLVAYQDVTNGVVDTVNTRLLMRNIFSGQWDVTDYSVSCLDEYNGTLLSGDSLSNNLFTLLSGFDDDGALIDNYYKTKQFNLKTEGMKKLNRFVIQGLIQLNQNIDIYFSFDNGSFVKLFTVQGNGSYVNTMNPTTIGSNTVGSQVVGGGSGVGPPVIAYPYEVEFVVGSDIFEYVQIMFQATGIGYCSIDQYTFKDIRWKARKVSPSRTIVY